MTYLLLGRPLACFIDTNCVLFCERAFQYSVPNECQFLRYVLKFTNQMFCRTAQSGVLPMMTTSMENNFKEERGHVSRTRHDLHRAAAGGVVNVAKFLRVRPLSGAKRKLNYWVEERGRRGQWVNKCQMGK